MAVIDTDLSLQERALLLNRLQFPLIARDYRDAVTQPEDDVRYALHEMLGNLEPATALLCAAMTLEEIALSHEGLTYLHDFCHGMIESYGRRVLAGEDIKAAELMTLSADLDQALELMEICRMSFEIVRPETLVFLDILIPQIESQVMIVDEVLRLRADFAPLSRAAKRAAAETLGA